MLCDDHYLSLSLYLSVYFLLQGDSSITASKMLTRRKAQVLAWDNVIAAAAELPREVHMHILSAIVSSTSSLSELDNLRRVCKAWNDTISIHEVFLRMLRLEKLCALERKAWGKSSSASLNNKRLPASFNLPFRGDCGVVNVLFRIIKSYKRPSLFAVEAKHSHATAQQVVLLLQMMCELEGAVCAMLFLVQLAPSNPQEWIDSITAGAAGEQHELQRR